MEELRKGDDWRHDPERATKAEGQEKPHSPAIVGWPRTTLHM
jgi:hypothetical protein